MTPPINPRPAPTPEMLELSKDGKIIIGAQASLAASELRRQAIELHRDDQDFALVIQCAINAEMLEFIRPALEALRDVQWRQETRGFENYFYVCSYCGYDKTRGEHGKQCKIAAALAHYPDYQPEKIEEKP